jgi:hypothetical protein
MKADNCAVLRLSSNGYLCVGIDFKKRVALGTFRWTQRSSSPTSFEWIQARPLPPLRPLKQLLQRHAQFHRERRQDQHRRIVGAPLQAPHHIGMNARKAGQCFLAQLFLRAPLPDFLSQTSQ